MTLNIVTRRGLAGIAAACLVSVALPAAPAMAQKVKTKPAEQAAASEPAEFSVSIPSVDAVDSSIDADTIKAILSGALVENADALAGLNASSITVPEIVLTVTSTVDGTKEEGVLTFTNLVLEDVVDGVAASASLEGSSFDVEDGHAEMGSTSATNFNIGGMLGIYGLVDAGGSTEMETLYADFLMEGGTFEAEDVSCEFGPVSGAEVRGRPIETSFVEIMTLAQQMEDDPEMADPALMGKFMRMYADILTAFESSEFTFDGFSCSGTDDDGRPMTFEIGNMTMAGMSPGIYPQISMNDFLINVEGDGSITLGNFTLKQFDLSSTIAALAGAPEEVDEAWLEANARALIPAFDGFSFAGLAIDIPDPDADGERIVADIDDFDLSLASYINGIPSVIDTSASGIRAALPEDTQDEQLQQLIALGITKIDAGFRLAAAWNADTSSIDVEEVSVSGVDLATVVLSGTIANATEALFSLDENEALMAGMGVAIKALNLDVTDAGLSDIILAAAAAEQGADPATLRPVFAGLAEGTVIGMMAGAADAAKLGAAINQFVSGTAKSLNIGIEAKTDPGLGMVDFMTAEEDPTTLIGKVNITASTK
ncbi:hypothetical protein JP75_12675 [Devosia riboflavina]|uniref:Choice-of-anchor G family protein n=1 Tax=Devosia riboflavina TaxID=46914 RepID=A0A087M1T6_9HYPH|nr:hypothetical protein [Devosia riboflavina]KFL30839.1 hypothetical protein JP75_12675 [Devosia riboflavina]